MRLFKYLSGGAPRIGAVSDGRATGVQNVSGAAQDDIAAALGELSAGGLRPTDTEALADPAGQKLLPATDAGSRVFCVGLNYAAHAAEVNKDPGKYPTIFLRLATSLVGHNQSLVCPKASQNFDFEGEVALVIGKAGRHISQDDALDHIGGVTCFNDGSLRDFQVHAAQYAPGKNFDQSGAVGPWIATADELDLEAPFSVETRLNGEVVQRSDTGDLVFGFREIIAYISKFTRLQPGDVIATGTPSGVGGSRTPKLFMRPGDKVEVEVGGVGVLANDVVQETE